MYKKCIAACVAALLACVCLGACSSQSASSSASSSSSASQSAALFLCSEILRMYPHSTRIDSGSVSIDPDSARTTLGLLRMGS